MLSTPATKPSIVNIGVSAFVSRDINAPAQIPVVKAANTVSAMRVVQPRALLVPRIAPGIVIISDVKLLVARLARDFLVTFVVVACFDVDMLALLFVANHAKIKYAPSARRTTKKHKPWTSSCSRH